MFGVGARIINVRTLHAVLPPWDLAWPGLENSNTGSFFFGAPEAFVLR